MLHSNDSNLKKSLSVALGIFVGLSPFWGFHTLITLFMAFVLRLNKVIAFAFSNISLPPLIPFIIYASLKIGTFCLGRPSGGTFRKEPTDTYQAFAQQHLSEYLVGSLVLAATSALVFGIVSYLLLHIKPGKKTSSI